MLNFMVDIVLKDGTPKLASISAESPEAAAEIVADWVSSLSTCGDAETEEFMRSIADYTIRPVEKASV